MDFRENVEYSQNTEITELKISGQKVWRRLLQICSDSIWKRIWEKTQDEWGLSKTVNGRKARSQGFEMKLSSQWGCLWFCISYCISTWTYPSCQHSTQGSSSISSHVPWLHSAVACPNPILSDVVNTKGNRLSLGTLRLVNVCRLEKDWTMNQTSVSVRSGL